MVKKLDVKIDNCFGIENFKKSFDFSKTNTCVVYARNGLMKTSFAKVFQNIQNDNFKENKDLIYGRTGNVEIKIDNRDICPEDIYVVRTMDERFKSNIEPLIINDSIKKHIINLKSLKDNLLESICNISQYKLTAKLKEKRCNEVEQYYIDLFELKNKSIVRNINDIPVRQDNDIDLGNVSIFDLLNDDNKNIILSIEFQNGMQSFLSDSESIYKKYSCINKDSFSLLELKKLCNNLKKHKFFDICGNYIVFGKNQISSLEELENFIAEIQQEVVDLESFKAIEKKLSTVKGSKLLNFLQDYVELVPYLMNENISNFQKIILSNYLYQATKEENYIKEINIILKSIDD